MAKETNINIGISEAHREKIADGLSRVLSETYTLYLKTQNYHWNVTGPMFHSLHTLFEQQYTEMIPAIDTIAERMRALGVLVPASFEEFSKRTSIKSGSGDTKDMEMVKQLVEGNEAVIQAARKTLTVADEAHDDPTVDMLTARLEVHEKTAWMLRSTLEKN